MKEKVDKKLGLLPVAPAWKNVISNPDKEAIFKAYFAELQKGTSAGAKLAVQYALRSREIGKQLVSDKVAFNDNDVNTVLLTGFFHAYGPINTYVK